MNDSEPAVEDDLAKNVAGEFRSHTTVGRLQLLVRGRTANYIGGQKDKHMFAVGCFEL